MKVFNEFSLKNSLSVLDLRVAQVVEAENNTINKS